MAAEPASNLVELFHASQGTTVGNILTAMTLSSWARVYNTAKLDDIVTAPARPLVSQENTPTGDVTAPLFIAQGLEDIVVAPAVQAQFVEDLCARGIALDYRTYPKAGHLNLHKIAGADITAWITERFAGAAAVNTCV